jgi:hypothetical protein
MHEWWHDTTWIDITLHYIHPYIIIIQAVFSLKQCLRHNKIINCCQACLHYFGEQILNDFFYWATYKTFDTSSRFYPHFQKLWVRKLSHRSLPFPIDHKQYSPSLFSVWLAVLIKVQVLRLKTRYSIIFFISIHIYNPSPFYHTSFSFTG